MSADSSASRPAMARFGGLLATGLAEVTEDLSRLGRGGRWAVLITYEGSALCARFEHWAPAAAMRGAAAFHGPSELAWTSSMDRAQYCAAVEDIRRGIARGDVYQANLCRILQAALPEPSRADPGGLHALLSTGNPAPYQGWLRLPGLMELATASPELFLRRHGSLVRTSPIKGTGRTARDLLPKDQAENVMIVDLMRNDLGRVCRPGSVGVPDLLQVEQHPGLVHLVSSVCGELSPGVTWPQLFEALLPAGSVSGAPKRSALDVLSALEPVPRGPYCGVVGWVDADRVQAELAVAIRTFWREGDRLLFGTGAGITWGSDPLREWQETELKAAHLLRTAAGH